MLPTLLALGAAVLHAAWNFAVKQSGDRFITLWAQFAVAGALALAVLLAFGELPAEGWMWAALSGLTHVPYTVLLAKAYDIGDFSLVYPIARGGGAAVAALLGVALLDDHVSTISAIGIGVMIVGLVMLSGRAPISHVLAALAVAATIATYSTIDAHGARSSGTAWYALATHVGTGVGLTMWGVSRGRLGDLRVQLRDRWQWSLPMGLASLTTYGMVVAAFRYAPVGYVTAIRECSVLIVAVLGWTVLRETAGARRFVAAAVVVTGLIVLVVGR